MCCVNCVFCIVCCVVLYCIVLYCIVVYRAQTYGHTDLKWALAGRSLDKLSTGIEH